MTFRAFLLEAEVLGWPLIDPADWECGATALPGNVQDGLRERLARHGHRGESRVLVDAVWRRATTVLALLRARSSELLCAEGQIARVQPDRMAPGREILRWRAVSLFLPPSVLLGALRLDGRPPGRVQVLDPSLRPSGPVAHLHLHLGAATSFAALWSGLAADHAEERVDPDLPPVQGFEAQRWRRILKLAFDFRSGFQRGRPGTPAPVSRGIRRLCDLLGSGVPVASDSLNLDTRWGHLPTWEAQSRRNDLVFDTRRRQRAAAVDNGESLCVRDPASDGLPNPEVRVIANMFDAAEADPSLESAVTQYLRVQTMLYRHFVMDATTGGLEEFRRYYKNIDPYCSGEARQRAVVDGDAEDLDLRAVEVRIWPKTTDQLHKAEGALAQIPVDERALVIHMIRAPNKETRWSQLLRRHLAQGCRVERALEAKPELLRSVRGLDLASEELRGPLWLALPAILGMRDRSRQLAAAYPALNLHPLRLTLHVGEDFTHLLGGLRAVHEPFLWQVVHRGDRLGHALALGLDPARWVLAHPRVYVRRWDRALDLLWARRLLAAERLDVPGALVVALTDELQGHLREARTGLDVHEAEQILMLLGDPEYLRSIAATPPSGGSGAQTVVADRLESPIEPDGHPWNAALTIEPAAELPLLRAIGDWLRAHIARWQTAIELNPSSNLIIGALDHPLAQPGYQIRPTAPTEPRALPTTVSADDPITFATTAADEYAYAWAGMVCEGDVPPGSARAWIDEAAASAWRARFTLPSPVHQLPTRT